MAEKVSSIPFNPINEDWYENNVEMVNTWISTGGNSSSIKHGHCGRRYEPSKTSPYSQTPTKSYKEGNGKIPSIPPRNPTNSSSQLKPPSINLTPAESIPEETITIPSDGCLYGFTADQMSTFFRYLKVHDRIISYMLKKGINGKKFSTLKDSELDNLSINNPIVCHFRERSKKKKAGFIL